MLKTIVRNSCSSFIDHKVSELCLIEIIETLSDCADNRNIIYKALVYIYYI